MKTEKKSIAERWLKRASIGFVALLVVWLWFIDWRAGCNWWSSILLFFPAQVWLAPLLVLLPAAVWLKNRRLCWLLLTSVPLVFLVFLRVHVRVGHPDRADVKLVSNNIDLRDLGSLWSFIDARNPDVIALQETASWRRAIRERFPDYHISTDGEFALVSRFPIVSATPVAGMTRWGQPLAIRYEVMRQGGPLVIYNVHMPTPRFYFRALRDDVLLHKGPPPEEGTSTDSVRSYREYWNRRLELAGLLIEAVRSEKKPYLLAGDFNMPDHGFLYRAFSSRYTDSFAKAGLGYGLTFPGNSTTIVSLYRPWMRIDYQFAGFGVVPLSCEVEPWSRAKHMALYGQYRIGSILDQLAQQ